MKIGVNWSGQRELPVLKDLLFRNDIDFIEILIDNFLHTDTDSINRIIDGRDCSFHIMNSQFLHKTISDLKNISNLILKLRKELNPIYISDHLGIFYSHNQAFPQMLEVDYDTQDDVIFNRVEEWQNILDVKILMENYPSICHQKNSQSIFYEKMMTKTNCGLLFDISNAIIAEKNVGEPKENWLPVLSKTINFHIGGFEKCSVGNFLLDTHNQCIDSNSLNFLKTIINTKNISTISVERDDNFNFADWSLDVNNVRGILNDR